MKKILTLSLFVLMCVSGFAQEVVLVFTGQDATTNQYVRLSRIEISDLTQGWTETLTYPDTTAILKVGTGITENAANSGFCLAQNSPNPFKGTTDVNLMVAESGPLTMEITDIYGRTIVESPHFASLQPGTHQFRVNVATAGVYFLTARQNGKTSSVKMVNNGNGTGNGIEYTGTVATMNMFLQTKNGMRGTISRPFAYGDAMTYKGFAIVDGEEIEGETKAQTQNQSENIILFVQTTARPCPGTPTVTDVDGNIYNTVQIGDQCWMKENLRTTRYADNTPIAVSNETSCDVAYRYEPGIAPVYGYLYNWRAVMGNSSSSSSNPSRVQGICPTGWHVPSNAEWQQLAEYVKSQSIFVCDGCTDVDEEWHTYCIAKALATQTGWDSYNEILCCIGDTLSGNNATGFSVLPAGDFNGTYNSFGQSTFFWSATVGDNNIAQSRALFYYSTYFLRTYANMSYCFSVRCVRD